MSDIEMSTERTTASSAIPQPLSPQAFAEAAERRARALPPQPSAAQLAAEHDRRLQLRRLIDPGIYRPNSKEQAFASLKTLLTIAENILKDPDNRKYHQFKPTNAIIRRNLVEPKGALEFAIELGFRPEVDNFQPYYTWNPRRLKDLEMGAAVLKEFIRLEEDRQDRAKQAKEAETAAKRAAANRVKLAFIDDRKTKEDKDRRERERREAHASALAAAQDKAAADPPDDEDEDEIINMPGSGHVLGAPTDSTATNQMSDDGLSD